MVKNIPAIERSTEIRFGKHVPDSTDQADNTIVFNASNVLVPTPYSNACYLSPIRNRTDYLAPEVVLLMYDRNTKEITESGESANVLVGGSTLNTVVDRSNATSNTMLFIGQQNDVAFVTSSNVGISNMLPQHTLSIGSNLYVDDVGSNVLTVSGNVSLLGNLHVSGSTTLLVTENTSIKDALFELGRDNTSTDTTLDLGLLMHRPSSSSNVVIGYREGLDEFAISYTESNPNEKVFIPKTDEDINVHVYGLTHVDANIYAHEDLHVSGNTHVTGTGTSTIPSLNVYRATSSTSRTTGALIVGGGLGVGGDIHATHANLEDVEADSVNITDTTASSSKTTGALKVAGGLGVAGALYGGAATFDDLTVDGTTLTVDTSNDRVGVKTGSPAYTLDINGDLNFAGSLYQGGSAFVSTPWTMETSPTALSYTAGNVGIGAANPQYKLEVDGDINIKSGHNLRIAGNIPTFSNWTVSNSNINRATGNVGIATATPKTKLHVHGGTIINSNGVAKKTYSYSGTLSNGQTIANSTIKLTFTNHVFSAKIVAHLVESPTEVSTISFECCGGHWSGSTPSTNIATSPVTVFGPASTNPWNVDLTLTSNTVSLKPTTNMAAAGAYNVFVEYISQNSAGELSSLHEGSTAEVSDFGY